MAKKNEPEKGLKRVPGQPHVILVDDLPKRTKKALKEFQDTLNKPNETGYSIGELFKITERLMREGKIPEVDVLDLSLPELFYYLQTNGYLTGLEKLHKQPRNLLKTVAQRISNTTEQPTLFTLPQAIEPGGGAIGELKEEISKVTGALAFYLIQKFQENSSRPLEINNLNSIAEAMNCNNYRLKLYLLYLGGYVYPIIDRDENTKELVLTNEQLFKIEFRYSKKVADKYSVNNKGEIQGVERIGTNILNFIKDEPIDRVIVTPSERFIKALEGKGLGNILTVNNKFVGLILELTDIATKILSYSASNKPSQKIAENNLVKHLGLQKQIKTQGRPRVRATILKGFKELQDKGHIKSYSYDEATGMYSYTYSDKYVKYKEAKKDKKTPKGGVQ